MRPITSRSLTALLVLLAAMSGGADAAEPADDEAAWLSQLVSLIADPAFAARTGSELVDALRPMIPLHNDDPRPGCGSLWSLDDAVLGFPQSASLTLTEPGLGASCATARLGVLTVLIRTQRKGADIAEVSRQLTQRFGTPVTHRSGDNTDSHWQATSRIAIETGVSDRPTEEDLFSITLAQAP